MTVKTQTIQDFVKDLTPDEREAMLVYTLFALERIAINSNPKREPPVGVASGTLAGLGWYWDGTPNSGFVNEMIMRGTIPGL